MRILGSLVLYLSLVASCFGQFALTHTRISVTAGLTNPKVVGDYVIHGEASKPVERSAALISLEQPDESNLVDIVAEQIPTLDLGELVQVDKKTFLLIGEGTYRVVAFFEKPAAVKRMKIELGPPPNPISVNVAVPEIKASKGESVKAIPVTASGGKGELSFAVSPQLPVGLSIASSTGEVSGSSQVAGVTSHTVTVSDTVGQKATGQFKLTLLDKPPPPIVPPDGFDNIGQRACAWATGLPRLSEVAALYQKCSDTIDDDPNASVTSAVDKMVNDRTKLLTPDELNRYQSALINNLNADFKKRWPMQASVAVGYFGAIATGLRGAK